MERELDGGILGHAASERRLRSMMRRVCEYYNVRPVRLRFVRASKSKDFGWTDATVGKTDHVVTLNRCDGQNVATLLHELAHYLSDCFYDDHASHGPEFCAIYMHLMDKFRVLPQDAFRAMARRWGVRIGREYLPATLQGRA